MSRHAVLTLTRAVARRRATRRPRARLPRRRLDRPAPDAGDRRERRAPRSSAIADPSRRIAAQPLRARARGARALRVARRRCSTHDLDGIVIATPSALHAEQAIARSSAASPCSARSRSRAPRPRRARVVDAARAPTGCSASISRIATPTAMQRIRELVATRRARRRLRRRPRLPQRLRARQGVVLRPALVRRRLRHRSRHPSRRSRALDARLPASMRDVEPAVRAGRAAARRAPTRSRTTPSRSSISTAARSCGSPARGTCPPGATRSSRPTFYGTRGGAALRNVDGSFYDFVAERYRRHARDAPRRAARRVGRARRGRLGAPARRRRALRSRRSSALVDVAARARRDLWPLRRRAAC